MVAYPRTPPSQSSSLSPQLNSSCLSQPLCAEPTTTPSFGDHHGFLSAAGLLIIPVLEAGGRHVGRLLGGTENAEACSAGFQDIRFFSGCENPNGKNDELTSAEPVKEEDECLDETVRHFPDRLYQ